MKLLLLCLTLSSCAWVVSPAQLRTAEEVCAANQGVERLHVSGGIVVECNNGAEFRVDGNGKVNL